MEYSEDYVKHLESLLWEMIDLNKRKYDSFVDENAVATCISLCLKEAEEYLNK